MQLNYDKFRSKVQSYLDSPDSEPLWDELANSVLFNIVGSLILLPIGIVLVCTIVLAKAGILMVWGILKSFLTLEVFHDQRQELKNHPEKIRPLLTAGIIIGPRGHGLALGSFSPETQEDLALLGRVSRRLGELYTEGSDADSDQDIVAMLRDDIYRSGRRRAVPKSHSEGLDLVLFDMEVDINETDSSDDVVWIACVAVMDEEGVDNNLPRGDIVQIPWSVMKSAGG